MTIEQERNLVNRVAIGDFLRRRARSTPDAVALADYQITGTRRISYAQLDERSNRFCRLLRSRGAVQGDRVVLIAPNCIDVATVMYACFKGGMVYVPLNFLMGDEDLAFVVDHASPSCAVIHPSLWQRWQRLKPLLHSHPAIILLGSEPVDGHAAADGAMRDLAGEAIMDVCIEDRAPAQIMYTSGTTARPKGAVHSHLAIVMWTMSIAIAFRLHQGDSYLCPLPFFHIGGQSHMLTHHHMGGTYVFADFDAARYARIIERERINGVFLLPMMWRALLNLPDIRSYNFASLKRALYAMAPMAAGILDELREVFGCPFDQASGQTETSIMTMYLDGTAVETPGANYWGRPISTGEQAVLDEAGRELPRGVVGEICWRAPTIMSEYYRDPEASAAVTRHGWHHSGDLGKIDQHGQLLFVDRKKDMIKSGGENVSSIRVEQVILGIPQVRAASVVGLPHARWGEAVTAFVVAGDSAMDPQLIVAQCRAQLARYEVPKRVLLVSSLPMTPTGKVLKHELRNQHATLYDGDQG